MRRPFGAALCLGVSTDAVALVESRAWGGQRQMLGELPLDTASAFPLALGAATQTLLADAGRSRWPLRVVLADELVRLWQLTPPPGCTRLGDLEAAAGLRFQQLYGEPAADWQIAADWHLARPFTAAAMPRAVLAVLQQAAQGAATPLVAAAPQFLLLFNRHRKAVQEGDWLGVVHDSVLTVGVCADGALTAVRPIALGAHSDSAWLEATLAREALRLTYPAPARLLLCGDAVPAWRAAPFCVRVDGEAGPASSMSAVARLALAGVQA